MSKLPLPDLGAYLREQRENAQLSLRQLAEMAGVSNPYLSQIERGLKRPSAEILQQIAKGLQVSAESLYVRAGILDERVADDPAAAPTSSPPSPPTRPSRIASARCSSTSTCPSSAPPTTTPRPHGRTPTPRARRRTTPPSPPAVAAPNVNEKEN